MSTPGVVVTGAAHGIGRAIAERFAAEGARVVVHDLDTAACEAVAAEIGGLAIGGDVSAPADVANLVATARTHLGRIDAFYSNAGVNSGAGLDTDLDTWDEVWRINVMSHVLAARELRSGWESHGGRFVITASAAGLLSSIGKAPYAVTKHAAVAFAEWLQLTYAHHGLVVQCLCPMGVRTRMTEVPSARREVLAHDGMLEPAQVADDVWSATGDDRFLILPHPEVQGYYTKRTTDTEAWLASMNKISRRVEQAEGA